MSGLQEKNQSPSEPRPTSCPNCGFDIEPGKPCQVCGYSASAPGAARAPARPAKRRGAGTVVALLLSAAGLVGLLTLFLLTTEQHHQTEAPAAQVAVPTPNPAPADVPSGTAADSAAVAPAVAPAGTAAAVPRAAASVPEKAPAPAASPKVASRSLAILLTPTDAPFDVTRRIDLPPFNSRDGFIDWMVSHTDETATFLRQKWDRAQIIQRLGNFRHERVREAFLLTPREFFCREPRRAYENAVLPIGYGQTISGPHLVSRMTDYLDPQPKQKVLEIGTGSGYQSALLSEITSHVYTIEIVEKLARETDAIYKSLELRYPEYRNVKRKIDDGYYGWEEYAPFDRIIVTCGIDHVPPALIRQLAPDGIMVIPIGPPSGQTILRIVKKVSPDGTVRLEREDIYHGKKRQIFVPFTAPGGGVHRAGDQKD